MKTRKIIISIFISVLTVTMYGQLAFIDGHSRFSSNMSNLDSNSFSGNESTEVAFELDSGVEEWMVVPFNNDVAEEELVLESWMSELFYPKLTVTGMY